ncbi:MAG: transposase [Erysipelotrichaceae bacterium]|nr:transposase [Erysipelotrichaceae bacterium]
MLLTYQFELKVNETMSIILGHLSYAASKLFNVGNYERKEYKTLGFDSMPDWYDQKKRLKDDIWYKSLPAQTSQDVLARLDEAWKSYFVLKSKYDYKKEKSHLKEYEGEPHSPYYKKDGSHTNFKYLQNSFKIVDNKVRLMIPKRLKEHLKEKYNIEKDFLYIPLKRTFSMIKQIEFSYINKNRYKVYVIYEEDIKNKKEDNKHYISIDIGTKNLLTVYDNNGTSFVVSGTSIQNTSYYFSKRIAYYQSKFDKCFPNHKKGVSTNRIKHLYELKNKRINLILHRASRYIVDYCNNHDISKVIIGDVSGILHQKKEFNSAKDKHRFNQNLRAICFKRIYDYLSYKLTIEGIEFIMVDEAYSSGCSPKSLSVSKDYYDKSQRKHRGLFKDRHDIYNADAVGAYNIMRIYRQEARYYFPIPLKGLSNPNREYIPVTDQFLNEDYINWNAKAGNVGISGRNYPDGYILEDIIRQYVTQILGNSITE